MKAILLKHLSVLFLLLITPLRSNQKLNTQAQEWVYTYVLHKNGTPKVSNADIQIIANLMYLSWARSAVTIKCQNEMLSMLNTMWKGWQNIAQTRLDPSVDQPYSIPKEQQKKINRFWLLAARHRTIGRTYSYAINMVLEKQFVENRYVLDGVANMRNNARTIVLDSLLDIRRQLGQFFAIDHNKSPEENYELIEQPTLEKNKGIKLFDFISAYIPQLALSSFIEANNLQNIVSEEGWNALKTVQDVGNYTWKEIETARANFYATYYTALFTALTQNESHKNWFKLMFNENGIIEKENQEILLPSPYKLSLTIVERQR